MVNSSELEVKAVVQVNALVLNRMSMPCISEVVERPLDMEVVKGLPGFFSGIQCPAVRVHTV